MDLRKLLELLRVRDSTLFICIPIAQHYAWNTVCSADVCGEKEGRRGEERREQGKEGRMEGKSDIFKILSSLSSGRVTYDGEI